MKPDPLRHLLESAYRDHHSHHSRERDPLSLVHRYSNPADQEVVGLIVAVLSYGNVRIILNSAEKVLATLGPSPSQRLREPFFPESLNTFRHRFTTGDDFRVLFAWIHGALQSHGSLESFFLDGKPSPNSMRDSLGSFVARFTAQPLNRDLTRLRDTRDRQLKYLLPDPMRGSACKRLNMYLRWMVRPNDGIDLGLWKGVSPSVLVLPLDTHLLQTVRALRWTRSRQATWKIAEAATSRLRRLCPEDPIRYDFALCHLSMEGGRILHYKAGHDAPTPLE